MIVEKPPRALSRLAFASLFATTLATAIGNMGLVSVMPAAGRALGISDFLVGSIFSLSAFMWAVFAPFWAGRSDRNGRKRYILIGLGGFIVSMLGCGFAVLAGLKGLTIPIVTFTAFLLVRSLYGVFGSAASAAAQAYVADRTDGRQRVRAIAGLGGALSIGTIVGPAIAPFLIIPWVEIAGPMFIFALAGIGVLVMVALGLPRDRRPDDATLAADNATADLNVTDASISPAAPRESSWAIWRNATVRPFLIYGFLMSSAQAANTYTLGFLVIDRIGLPPMEAQAAIGMAMVAGALAGLFAQWGLVSLYGMMPKALLRWGAALACLGNILIVLLPGYTAILGTFALINFGYGLARPGYTAGASLVASRSGQGVIAGAVASIAGGAIVISPIISVGLYEWTKAAPFILCAIVMGGLFMYALIDPALSRTARQTSKKASDRFL